MKSAISLSLATALLLATSGCNKRVETAADTNAIADSIKAQEAQWEKDYASKDVSALAGHYVDDAVLGSPGEPLAASDVDRRKSLIAMVSDPNLNLTFAPDQVEVAQSGDLAYTRGHYSMQMTDKATKQPVKSDGTYLTVYKKQSDGSWKAIEDFIIPGPAPAAAK